MDLADTIYAAATDEIQWNEVAHALEAQLGASSVSCWLGNEDGTVEMLHAPPVGADRLESYASYYHKKDLWTTAGLANLRSVPQHEAPNALLLHEIVPEGAVRCSEFYTDFARHIGIFHVVGSVVSLGKAGWLALGCHRPEGAKPFGEVERRRLDVALPHFRRALQIRHRLRDARLEAAEGALNAMSVGAIVVDRDMRILFANSAAERLAIGGGVQMRRHQDGVHLEAERRSDTLSLEERVRQVVLIGGDGGAVALQRSTGGRPLAALVMPLPRQLVASEIRAESSVLALVLLHDTGSLVLPQASVIMDLYSLSRVEAEVALAAAAGSTAEAIASSRRVAASTIRTHLRSVLEKSSAATLRDLTRLLARLAD